MECNMIDNNVNNVGVEHVQPLQSEPHHHHRRSIRLKGYDYSQTGFYFITVCVHDKNCLLGEIKDNNVILSEIGNIAHNNWIDIPNHFKNVQLDEFVVMPNHVHGIVIIDNNNSVGVEHNVRVQHVEPQQFQHIMPQSIGAIM